MRKVKRKQLTVEQINGHVAKPIVSRAPEKPEAIVVHLCRDEIADDPKQHCGGWNLSGGRVAVSPRLRLTQNKPSAQNWCSADTACCLHPSGVW
ncbi:hypothetical protein ELI46_30295 (plasmid) [Rhizobium ruizarguesonis]|nr:hypothetical protein ELI46_30295 [Rhizobium ruizarguesonis]